jgi:hypothetical protein
LTKNLLIHRYFKDLRRLCPSIKFQMNKNEVSVVINSSLLIDILFFLKFHCFYQSKQTNNQKHKKRITLTNSNNKTKQKCKKLN